MSLFKPASERRTIKGHFNQTRSKEPTKEEYEIYTAAAKAADLITKVVPYGVTNHIVNMTRPMRFDNIDPEKRWYNLPSVMRHFGKP